MRWLLIVGALLLAACQRTPTTVGQESYVFGTRVEILVWGESEDKARGAINAALREFDRLHREYHAWQPSALSRLNAAIAAGESFDASDEMADFLREARDAARMGDHLFDPGIGRLIALWGFHSDEFKAELPDAAKLATLVASKPSVADLHIDGNRVTSRNRAVAIDLGGYLKGVALDRAAEILKAAGIANALINIGGNVMAMGSKGGAPWRVGIQHPRAPAPLATLDLLDGEAIGTSGDYQRYFEVGGRRYCHLLDPRSGGPADGTQAVTVLVAPRARAGMWSDVASKPIFIAGADWRGMAERLGFDRVLRVDADGKIDATPAMRERIQMAKAP